jgi:hypothetical protein
MPFQSLRVAFTQLRLSGLLRAPPFSLSSNYIDKRECSTAEEEDRHARHV